MDFFSADIKDLLSRLQERDEEAFNEIFLALYPRLCLFAERFVQDSSDAEDIVEEAFIKLWNQPVLFNDDEHLKASLYRSIRNACLNFLKVNQRRVDRDSFFFEERGEYDEATYLSEITRTELLAELYAAISELPPQAQKVIIKSYIEGQSNQEVADDLSLSINTVKNHKQHGLALLRKKLSDNSYFLLFILSSLHFIDRLK